MSWMEAVDTVYSEFLGGKREEFLKKWDCYVYRGKIIIKKNFLLATKVALVIYNI